MNQQDKDRLRNFASILEQAQFANDMTPIILSLLEENERLTKDAERLAYLEAESHWEADRDMGPGGHHWVSINVPKGRPDFCQAIDAAMQHKGD